MMLTPENIDKQFAQVKEIVLKKNADYGSAAFDKGQIIPKVMLYVKAQRFWSITEKSIKGEQVNYESMEDTLRDIIGYAVISLVMLAEDRRKRDNELNFLKDYPDNKV